MPVLFWCLQRNQLRCPYLGWAVFRKCVLLKDEHRRVLVVVTEWSVTYCCNINPRTFTFYMYRRPSQVIPLASLYSYVGFNLLVLFFSRVLTNLSLLVLSDGRTSLYSHIWQSDETYKEPSVPHSQWLQIKRHKQIQLLHDRERTIAPYGLVFIL